MNLSQALSKQNTAITPKQVTNFSKPAKPVSIIRNEKGDETYSSTGTYVTDMVAKFGAMRNSSTFDITQMFSMALQENSTVAMQMLFYFRDIPNRGGGGQGERRIFHECVKWLVETDIETFNKVYPLIPEYGSWKDIRTLTEWAFNTRKDITTTLFMFQFNEIQKGNVLAAKWALDQNISNRKLVHWMFAVLKQFGFTPRKYRKLVNNTRKGVVERKMSEQNWYEINYEQVPSQAMKIYRKAFGKHDPYGFGNYIDSVTKGTKSIKAGTLNPVQLVHEVFSNGSRSVSDKVLDAQWNALPNFVDENVHALVMADVSGSMNGTPIEVSISLAMYFAERNKGMFANKFLTFSEKPALQEVQGKTLREKIRILNNAHWDMNTNIDKAFTLVLNTAVKHSVAPEDMPSVVMIISDMQFDNGWGGTQWERLQRQYLEAGYELPKVVYWNVNGKIGQPAPLNDNAILVSGYNPGILKSVFNLLGGKSDNIVESILSSGRYDAVAEVMK